jgi:hypothetical protein
LPYSVITPDAFAANNRAVIGFFLGMRTGIFLSSRSNALDNTALLRIQIHKQALGQDFPKSAWTRIGV